MIHLIEYFFESENLQDLKDHIKDNVDDSTEKDESLLKKIDKMLQGKGLSRETFEKRLEEVGLSYATKTLIQKINHFDNLPEFITMYGDIDKLPSTADLLKSSDIYELFGKYNIDKELLEELAELELAKSGINKGKFEILTQLFIKDMSTGNKNYSDDGGHKSGDVNAGGFAIEYKLSGARIVGQGTLTSPELIYNEFEKLLKDVLYADNIDTLQKNQSSLLRNYKPDELEKELDDIETKDNLNKEIFDNIDNCFKKEANFKKLFTLIQKCKINDNLINTIIAKSILKQIPKNKYKISKEEETSFIEFVTNKQNAPIQDGTPDYTKIKYVFGAFHMYFYQHIERFDYMILFKKKGDASKGIPDGKYVVINKDEFKDFESIKTAFIDKKINVATMPAYNTAREYAITITCKS